MKTRKNSNCKLTVLFSFLALFATAIMACKKDKPTPITGSANVMAVHASADAKAADFYLGDTKINTAAIAYGANTNYVSTPSGSRKAEFRATENNAVLASATADLVKDKNYSIFFAGAVAAADVVIVGDDLTAPPAGKAKVRFVNLSTDNTKVDFKLKEGGKLATGADYKSVSNFLEVNPGNLTYEILKSDDNSVILYTTPALTIEAGKIYTVWLKGSTNGTGDAALGTNLIVHNK